ncbi:MAG: hypothetical protein QNJ54_29645 [Prochloraceae cyanobacterium]|nr:hypothetical protein [Prochloraceae cyanobacterium]
MKSSSKNLATIKGWNIKLQVSVEEERRIKKDAIDYDMKVAEYIKHKLLDNLSPNQNLTQGKSA